MLNGKGRRDLQKLLASVTRKLSVYETFLNYWLHTSLCKITEPDIVFVLLQILHFSNKTLYKDAIVPYSLIYIYMVSQNYVNINGLFLTFMC